MSLIRHAARTMLASYFIAAGLDAVRDPDAQIDDLGDVAEGVARKVGSLPDDDPAATIRANGAIQMGAGLALATNTLTRPAALALAGTLVPGAMANRFWESEGAERKTRLTALLKELALFGGLVIVGLDTEGRPGMFWKTGYAVKRAGELADHQKEILELRSELALEKARHAGAETATRVRSTARQARRDAKMAGKAGRSTRRAVSSAGRGATRAVKAVTPL